MKKIGIDARLLFQTGVGTYVQNLLYYLSARHKDAVHYKAYVLDEELKKAQKWLPGIQFTPTPHRWHTFAEQTCFGLQLLADKLDLMHFTYFGHPIWYPRAFISTVHDLTPLFHTTGRVSTMGSLLYGAKHLAYRVVLGNQIQRSRCVITPSQTVREQIIAHYGEGCASRIRVATEGVSYRLLSIQTQALTRTVTEPYYLYVGNYYPHKNVPMLLRAFLQTHSKRKLVLSGPDDFFLYQIKQNNPEVCSSERIVFIKSPSVHDVASLYYHCDALINPSLSEGFGLPLAEAAYFHKPVLGSDIPVFRELLGDTLYSFDPYDMQSLIRVIEAFECVREPIPSTLKHNMSFADMADTIHSIYKHYVS